MLKTEH